jgi:hypothetical protein
LSGDGRVMADNRGRHDLGAEDVLSAASRLTWVATGAEICARVLIFLPSHTYQMTKDYVWRRRKRHRRKSCGVRG